MLSLQNLNLKLSSADLIPSPSFSENIGLGTTGLGPQCNSFIAKDREQYIKKYVDERDKLRRTRSPDLQTQKKGRGTSGSRMDYKALKQKIEQAKEQVRLEMVKQRKANEEMIEANRRAEAEEKKAEVERERVETKVRQEKQREAKKQFITAWKEQVRQEISRDREILDAQQRAEVAQVAARHEQQKQFREFCKQRAEQERIAREALEKEMVNEQKAKLKELNQERVKIHQDVLQFKRSDVVNYRSERAKKVAKMKEQAVKDVEQARELNLAEKERFLQELAQKRRQIVEYKRQRFETLNPSTSRSGSRSPSPTTQRGQYSSRVGSPAAGSPTARHHAMTSRSAASVHASG